MKPGSSSRERSTSGSESGNFGCSPGTAFPSRAPTRTAAPIRATP
jgi:hypothetical protein